MRTINVVLASLLTLVGCGAEIPEEHIAPPVLPPPAAKPCPHLSLEGLFSCRNPSTAVVSVQHCGGTTIATALYNGQRYSSNDGGKSFSCDSGAACPADAAPPIMLCLQF